MVICCGRAAGRGGPRPLLLGPHGGEDDESAPPCSPVPSLWSPREPPYDPESLREREGARKSEEEKMAASQCLAAILTSKQRDWCITIGNRFSFNHIISRK